MKRLISGMTGAVGRFFRCGCVVAGFGVAGVAAEAPAVGEAGGAGTLRAEDVECWVPGTLLVSGGWEGGGYGLSWTISVVEVVGEEEVAEGKATAYLHRSLTGLELGDYLRFRAMDDARLVKEFERQHRMDEESEYKYWQQMREGAVWYWAEALEGEDEVEDPDVAVPAELAVGTKFRSFDSDTVIAARDGALKGPWGVCEAVRMDTIYPEEVEDDEVYPEMRTEVWMGRGLSAVSSRTYEAIETEAEREASERPADAPRESLISETRLLRVIRPATSAGDGGVK